MTEPTIGLAALELRPATRDDTPFLYRMLALAASMDEREESVRIAESDSLLRGYVEGFGRPGDLGVVAMIDGAPAGAAWSRLLRGKRHPSKLWTRTVPELAIATAPIARGRGIGSAMLAALLDRARGAHPAMVLSVREGSPAVRLYERHGFVVERRITNRVGTTSLAMRIELR